MSISALGSSGLQTATPINYPSQPGTTAGPSSASVSTATSTASDASAANPSAETVKKAAATVEKFINSQANTTQTQFSVDKSSELGVVKVFDTSSNQEIAQYPSKEIVALAQAIDKLQGLMSTTGVLHNSTA